jgi:hypothetical protein
MLGFVCLIAVSEPLFDIKAGGTPPQGTSIVQAEVGFSQLPSIAYHYAVADSLTVGARFSFDYGEYAPSAVFQPALWFQVPVRLSALRRGALSLGVHFDPGAGVGFPAANAFLASAAIAEVLLGAGADVAYHLNIVVLGGGIDMPVAVYMPASGGQAILHWPLLFGPIFELHPVERWAVTLDARIGPLLSAPGTAVFAFKLLLGAAYRF